MSFPGLWPSVISVQKECYMRNSSLQKEILLLVTDRCVRTCDGCAHKCAHKNLAPSLGVSVVQLVSSIIRLLDSSITP